MNRAQPLHPVQRWAEAFRDHHRFTSAKYNIWTNGQLASLHGHDIAWRDDAGLVWLSMRGWGTPTTRDRLHAITAALGVPGRFHQARGKQHFNGRVIDVYEHIPLCGPLTRLALEFERAERAGRLAPGLRAA